MTKSIKKRLTVKELLKKGVPAVLIPGLLMAGVLGWNGKLLNRTNDYYQIKTIFPDHGVVREIEDGDTFILKNGVSVRLLGINAPGRGETNYYESTDLLVSLIDKREVFLEYDRYQDDKYGRVLAWIWLNCESKPKLLPADYMHLTYNSSRPGLTENPAGCRKGLLVNEEMVKSGLAGNEKYKGRGELKYEMRLTGKINSF